MLFTEEQRLEALLSYDIAGTLPEPNFDRITLVAAKVFASSFCTLNLVEAERLWIKSHFGIEIDQLPRSMSFCDHTIRSDDVMVVPDATADARFADAGIVAGAPHIRFYAGAPLITPTGARIGTLCLLDTSPIRTFAPENAVVLSNLAQTAMELIEARAREIKLAQLTRQISHQALHDPLTGLPNRRGLLARANEMKIKANPGDQAALLYIDLDGFKAVNDAKGHQAGDQLLILAAQRLRQSLRDCDCIARIGGDEFVILMQGAGDITKRARMVAARLVEKMREPFFIAEDTVSVGASIGVVAQQAADVSLEDMLKRADAMLYEVKASGKGNFLVAPDVGHAVAVMH